MYFTDIFLCWMLVLWGLYQVLKGRQSRKGKPDRNEDKTLLHQLHFHDTGHFKHFYLVF